MTSTSSMYRMKPLFEMNTIDVKTNMYKIRNIHDAGIVCNGTSEDDDSYLEFIEGRQEVILKRLKQLKDLLEAPIIIPSRPSPKIDSPPAKSVTKMTVQAVDFVKCGITQDILLNVSPSQLPYSLLGLSKLWKEVVSVNIFCHSHSSIRSLPKAALDFQEKLLKGSSTTSGTTLGQLNIRLVWKEVDADSIFVISPLKSVPIFGEVNFLRFLNACVGPKPDPVQQTILDDKLDSVFALTVDPKNALHVQNVFAPLKSFKWLLGDGPTVLDLAAWSVVTRQSKSIPLDPKGKQWFDNSIKLFS